MHANPQAVGGHLRRPAGHRAGAAGCSAVGARPWGGGCAAHAGGHPAGGQELRAVGERGAGVPTALRCAAHLTRSARQSLTYRTYYTRMRQPDFRSSLHCITRAPSPTTTPGPHLCRASLIQPIRLACYQAPHRPRTHALLPSPHSDTVDRTFADLASSGPMHNHLPFSPCPASVPTHIENPQ